MEQKDRLRTEEDALGSVQIPENVLYGINTVRAMENFHLRGNFVNYQLVRGIVTVKKAAALTYEKLYAEKKKFTMQLLGPVTKSWIRTCENIFRFRRYRVERGLQPI